MYINLEDLPPKFRKQAEEQLKKQDAKWKAPSKHKYNNEPCEVLGIKFDSRKECHRYLELKGMYEAGIIKDLKLQHHFTLQEAFKTVEGESIRKMEYVADFTYIDENGKLIIEDVKSEATAKNEKYKLKKKLMAEKGYMITEV